MVKRVQFAFDLRLVCFRVALLSLENAQFDFQHLLVQTQALENQIPALVRVRGRFQDPIEVVAFLAKAVQALLFKVPREQLSYA